MGFADLDEIIFNSGSRLRVSDKKYVLRYMLGRNYRSICVERPGREDAVRMAQEKYEREEILWKFNSFWTQIYHHEEEWRVDFGFGTAEYLEDSGD